MRKFKHIPTGDIATETTSGYNFGNTIGLLPKRIVESGNDWQEIFEPTYQILSFKNPKNGNIYNFNPNNGTYGYVGALVKSKQYPGLYESTGLSILYHECLKRYSIHSIKRLSDDFIVTCGKIYYDNYFGKVENISLGINGKDIFIKFAELLNTFAFSDIRMSKEYLQPVTATVTVTYSDKRPKQITTLQQGDQLFIKF